MRYLRLSVLVLFLGVPATVRAQPGSFAAAGGFEITMSGEPVASVDVFYDAISPYGVWIEDPRFGLVFIPDTPQYVPYRDGHWQYTNVGFVWISSEPFAWATTHYGRWVYLRSYHRWAWRPDTVWGPSWVEWRQYDNYFGWAPLAPDFAIEIGYTLPIEYWHYCGATHIFDVHVSRYYEPPRRVIDLHRQARPVQNYASVGGARVSIGPSAATLRQRRVDVRPTAIEPRAMGRWTHDEARAAAARAGERREANDARNRQRLQSNPALRQATPPAKQPQIQQPRQPQVQQPRQPQVQQPGKHQVQQPAKQPQVQQPAKQPQVQPPAMQPQIQQPAKQPQIQQPAKQPQVQQPAKQPQVQQPRQPQVQQPAKQPQVQQPAKQPQVQQPATQPKARPTPRQLAPARKPQQR